MSKWDNFKKKVGEIADKTVDKTREVTDSAALKIKIANKEADRDTEYRNLGRIAYIKLKNTKDTDQEELTRKISESMEKLDRILQELAELKDDESRRRAEKEAEKKARAEEKARQAAEDDEEQPDMSVMEGFNEARKEADVAYEEAKQAAEEAKEDADKA